MRPLRSLVGSSLLLGSTLLGTGCATVHPLTQPQPAAQAALTLGVDTHLHVTMSHAAGPLFRNEPGDGEPLSSSPKARLVNQVDAKTLSDAGVRLIFAALWPPPAIRPGRTAFDETLTQLTRLQDFSLRRGDFAMVRSVTEARRALAQRRVAMFPQVEGGEGITRVEDVDALYAAGVRCLTIVHFVSTQLGGAAKNQLGRAFLGLHDATREERGLSDLGKTVVTRMAELGMLIDVAHASDRTLDDVLAITEPLGVPVIVSHTGSRALMPDVERNLSDEHALRIVRGGGLIGVSLFPAQLETPAAQQLPQHQPGTCDDVVAHWKHFAQLVGPEALVMGSDMNGFIVRPAAGGLCPDGVRNAGDLPQLWAALVSQGVPREALDGMGDRLLQLLTRVEAKATSKPSR